MEILLATIAKKEQRYLRQFVQYYLKLGVTTVIIADNNELDNTEDNYNLLLEDYIKDSKVIIENYRGQYGQQLNFYNSIKTKYKYDWALFFDVDEYLTLNMHNNIKDFLNSIPTDKFNGIKINWQVYGDNNHIYYEDKPLLERFTKPMPITFRYNYTFCENWHIKSIIKGNVDYCFTGNPHVASNVVYAVPISDVKPQYDYPFQMSSPFNPNMCFGNCYIKHIFTKSLEEWLLYKMNKGRADMEHDLSDCYNLKNFFKYNKLTIEKVKFLKDKNIDISNFINY